MHTPVEQEIEIERDVSYANNDNARQRVDIYRPKQRSSAPLPVIVFFHGGGWLQGDRSDCGRVIPQFLRQGQFAAVAAGYRLSSEATWPAQLDDTKAAIRWVRANAAKYGFDAERIGVWGASAGGHLGLLLGTTADRPQLEGGLGSYPHTSSRVVAVANYFGITELGTLAGKTDGTARAEELLIGGPLRDHPDQVAAASPIRYVSRTSAPVLTVHGTADATVPFQQGARFDAALREAGGTSYLVEIAGGGHGNFGLVANHRVEAFFEKYLLGRSVDIDTSVITEWQPIF